MFQAIAASIGPALGREALTRVTLLLNHILLAEPEATRRLRAQTGRLIRIGWDQWPAFLPPPPDVVWRITPAGLLEVEEADAAGDGLSVTLDHRQWLGWLMTGRQGRPPMDIQGDAAFAAEVAWLAENLRWDIEDDLARLVGEVPAHELARFAHGFVEVLGKLMQRLPGRNG